MLFVVTWMSLEIIILTVKSEKDIYDITLRVHNITTQMNLSIKQTDSDRKQTYDY